MATDSIKATASKPFGAEFIATPPPPSAAPFSSYSNPFYSYSATLFLTQPSVFNISTRPSPPASDCMRGAVKNVRNRPGN